MMVRMTKEALKDKTWARGLASLTARFMGEPMEFHSQGEIYEGSLDISSRLPKEWLYYEDDLYTNMAFLEILREKGLNASQDDFADVFRKSDFMLWHANGQARQNLLAGVPPED